MTDTLDIRAATNAIVQSAYDAYVHAGEHYDPATGARLDAAEEVTRAKERLRGCARHLEYAIKLLNGHPERHLAEVIIRIADAAGALGFDLAAAVEQRTEALHRSA